MAAVAPLGGARYRLRPRRGISAAPHTGEWMKGSICVAKGRSFNNNEDGRRKRRSSSPPSQNPELSEEIIFEILARLPVKSLVGFKSVCKAWRATISSDPIFIHAHLRHSATKREQDPCVMISPLTLDESRPSTFSNQFRFYQWHPLQGNGSGATTASSKQTATQVYTKDLDDGEVITHVGYLAFCDGLVLVRTDTEFYLINPATRNTLTLPNSKRYNLVRGLINSAGLGLDPRSSKYKVVRAFYYQSFDTITNGYRMGMEVFTIGAGSRRWRKAAHDPPYPIHRCQTSLAVKGLMFWCFDRVQHGCPRGLLHLNLADESFGVTRLPDSMDPALDDAFNMDMLRGELWLTAHTSRMPDTMTIWAMPVDDEGGQGQWEQRYSIVGYPLLFRPLALLPGSRVLVWKQRVLYSYDPATSMLTKVCEMDRMRYQGRTARKWKNLFKFNVRLYTESLVPLTA